MQNLHQAALVDVRGHTASLIRGIYCYGKEKDKNVKQEREDCFNLELNGVKRRGERK